MRPTNATSRRRLLRLTANDRCDKCGARGYVLAVFAAGELVFCGHHGRQFAATLSGAALVVHDESDQLAAA